jgi:chromosome segregation ATPase
MAQDVSVKSIQLLGQYQSQLKDFDTAVNILVSKFRKDAEKELEPFANEYSRLNQKVEELSHVINRMAESLGYLKYQYNFGQEDLETIDFERERLNSIISNLQAKLDRLMNTKNNIEARLNTILEHCLNFSNSNRMLLNCATGRLEKQRDILNTYNPKA